MWSQNFIDLSVTVSREVQIYIFGFFWKFWLVVVVTEMLMTKYWDACHTHNKNLKPAGCGLKSLGYTSYNSYYIYIINNMCRIYITYAYEVWLNKLAKNSYKPTV